jgi:MFS transporter, DHA1 family, multidrug resistance protein
VSGLGGNAAMVGIITAVASVTTMLGQLAFGRITDRKGDIFVQVITGLLLPLPPLAWMIIARPEQAIFINIASGALWAGYNLASFNILLKLTPDDHRPEATAIYQTLVTSSAVVGPLIGGALADSLGFKAVFAVSGIVRFLAMFLFIALVARPGPLLRLRRAGLRH